MHPGTRDRLAYACVAIAGLAAGLWGPRTDRAAASAAGSATRAEAPVRDLEHVGAGTATESPELRALAAGGFDLLASPDSNRSARPMLADGLLNGPSGEGSPSRGEVAEGERVDWLDGLKLPDLPVRPDAQIGRFVQYFTKNTQGRDVFRAWLKRSGRYRSSVAASLREHLLPIDLQALVFIESGFSPTAVSTAGAVGLWQLMPETGRAYGLAVEKDYDERRSVARASEAATRHLADLYEQFGSWELALAAYDMGYGALISRIRDMATNDYWALSSVRGVLPREAVLYVPKVLAVSLILRNLEHFGLDDVRADAPLHTSDLEVPAGVNLATVARAAGTSVQSLRELNPELLGDRTPFRSDGYFAHIPSAGHARAQIMLPRLLENHGNDGLEEQVAASFDWGRDEVPQVGDHGQRLRDRGRANRTASADPDSPTRREAPSEPTRSDEPADRGRQVVYYRVGERESLASISRTFGESVDEIVEENQLDPTAKLQRGMLLTLRVAGPHFAPMVNKRAGARQEAQRREVSAEADKSEQQISAVPPGFRQRTEDARQVQRSVPRQDRLGVKVAKGNVD